jgi:hypothetical protein
VPHASTPVAPGPAEADGDSANASTLEPVLVA